MYIDNLVLPENPKILHIAPEPGIYKAVANKFKSPNYVVADLFPENFSFVKNCKTIDLTNLDNELTGEYDLIMHCHVMEHIPCNIAYTLYHLHRMLKTNGKHVCIIPFMGGFYDECFQVISDKERIRRFGQNDHVRRFGREDINMHLGKIINVPNQFDARETFSESVLKDANIPEKEWTGFGTSTVLLLNRLDMKFLL
ncbi:hypothetical protein N9344_00235 [bacterium]|nr:hypothetical protein [bacterium]